MQLSILLLVQAASTLAVSVYRGKHHSPRPCFITHPHYPTVPNQPSPPRTRDCYVQSHNDSVTNDSPYNLSALHACNNGGHVIFDASTKYTIGTALDMTFLRSIDIDIQGYIQFTNDTDYWQAHSFKQVFQNATTFFKLGGEDVNVYRGGTLDGNGQVWYDLYAQDIYTLRPILFGTVGLHSGTISNLNLIYSPQYYNWVANPSNVIFSHISITGFSTSNNTAKKHRQLGHVPERRDHDPELGRQPTATTASAFKPNKH
ncbi:hypothetical protein G647_05969 [Cladophialophora carrionii CBS 160.54]|uniref:galacturonan 1,4-alpha-galacturonidase n=1 Tax=Cladophialophora carrionii CBS 160.54 TaxID=1279043 RepID=V9D4T9_9EURO|nr:uncharacterized protein G647_05969 [Cladophialophora carrionii CBS 160.54]ETI21899.1 hypothetical protein G647_05969 [Cladophialophora carrionii CBS 160.54]